MGFPEQLSCNCLNTYHAQNDFSLWRWRSAPRNSFKCRCESMQICSGARYRWLSVLRQQFAMCIDWACDTARHCALLSASHYCCVHYIDQHLHSTLYVYPCTLLSASDLRLAQPSASCDAEAHEYRGH